MRTALVLLSLAAALVASQKYADKELLLRQQKIYHLLYHADQPFADEDLKTIAREYKPEENLDKYEKPEVVEKFLKFYKHGYFRERGEVFSVTYKDDKYQVNDMFDVLFYAKDFDTFYKTAAWLRARVNVAQFVYALTVAALHRADTSAVTLPAPYEIHPQLFVTAGAIQRAYDARLKGHLGTAESPYVIESNYTGYPEAYQPEDLVSYFTEDVGLNSFFAYMHYRFPFWMQYNFTRQGETFYFTLRQLLGRYYLERLSNNLPDVRPVDYYKPVKVGYYPEIRLKNGLEVPSRPEGISPRDVDFMKVEEIEIYERRIRFVTDLGIITDVNTKRLNFRGRDSTEIIGNIVEGNMNSVHRRFYGSFYRGLISLLGQISDPLHKHEASPSVFELPETMLRDPIFYRIAKRVLSVFEDYKDHLEPYTSKELLMPGVKIESFTFEELVTYFDDFDIDLSNVVGYPRLEQYDRVNVVVRQPRLNHKPFNYQIKVNSEKPVDAVVRVFIGPRFDAYGRELTIEERKNHYVLMDIFRYPLVAGDNVIERNSSNNGMMLGVESPRFRELYARTVRGLRGEEKVLAGELRHLWGFPQRLLLPRGSAAGLPLSAYVIFSPALGSPASSDDEGVAFSDPRALGFPFDRRIHPFEFKTIPNARFQNIVVKHRQKGDLQDEDNGNLIKADLV